MTLYGGMAVDAVGRAWFIFVMLMTGASWALAEPEFVRAKTVFQTNVHYDPRVAIAVDAVIVHRHADDPTRPVGSWRQAGFPVGRMFFADSDAGNIYWTGKWDGQEHPGDVERDRNGQVVLCAGVRPYMLPTEGWIRFLEENTVKSLDAGAAAILPEEPLAHVFSGYEDAFKPLWLERYGIPWRGQHENAEARWLTAQLKNELYIKLEKRLLERTRRYAQENDREVGFVLPIHAMYSNIAAQLVAPLGTSVGVDGIDGYIGQIWTGPVNWALAHYDAPDKTFFASAYVLYDYFTQLTVETDRTLWLLVDPVEDNPNHTWAEFAEWYKHCVVAMLLMDDVDSYEIMPWPDRIFLPGHQTGGGTPAPEDYRITILSVTQALQEVPEGGHWLQGVFSSTLAPQSHAEGIGVAVADTLMWQRHEGPWLQGMYGLLLPLVHEGLPASSLVMERVADPAYLARFKVIILSYEDFKPLEAGWNVALARWVHAGGSLIVLEHEADELDRCERFWWRGDGFESPTAHLLSVLGLSSDASGWVPRGSGAILRLSVSPRNIGKPGLPQTDYLRGVREGIKQATGIACQTPGSFCMQRGDFVVAHAASRRLDLAGTFVDVFDPSLPIVKIVHLAPGHSGLYRNVADLMQKGQPALLHCTHRLTGHEVHTEMLTFSLRGPAGTPAVARVYLADIETPHIVATDSDGQYVAVDAVRDDTTQTVRLRFPNDPKGVTVTVRSSPKTSDKNDGRAVNRVGAATNGSNSSNENGA